MLSLVPLSVLIQSLQGSGLRGAGGLCARGRAGEEFSPKTECAVEIAAWDAAARERTAYPGTAIPVRVLAHVREMECYSFDRSKR